MLECVGLDQSTETSIEIARPGVAVRLLQERHGRRRARAGDVLEGRIEPGRVFDRAGSLDEAPEGYRAMDARESIKFLIEL